MGNTASVALEPLHRLSGATPIVADDNDLWESLHSLELPSSSAEELQAASHAFCAEMVRNNTTSGNFRTLLRRTVDVLRQAQKPKAATAVLRQACGCVFLLRLYLKHMIETLEPAELAAHLSEPPATADATLLVAPLVTELRQSLVRVELKEDSYLLHMEAAAALTVCLSTQLFATLTDETPQPFVACTLSSSRADADALIATLLQHVLSQPPPPQPSTGLLRRLGRGMKSVLLLPYYSLTYLFYPTDDEAAPPALSDRAIQLLLLLTQHPPSTLLSPAADGTTPHNPFLDSLREMSDRQHEWPAASADSAADGDPESGQLRVASVPYRELHDAIASALPEQASALLLYLLLHGNRDYLDYSLSRTDPETILVPLLRVLHDSRSLPTNRLYMLLILLLMLSQDHGFVTACQSAYVPSVPWYKTRLLGSVSVSSLLVIVLVRTIQTNLAGAHDSYVHTNCLAALANVAPHLRKLHPHAARCLLSLIDLLARKYHRHARKEAGGVVGNALAPPDMPAAPADAASERDSTRSDATDTGGGDGEREATAMAADFLRIALEATNLCLAAGPALNEHLVYAMLERQKVFEPLRDHELFSDLIINIDLVLDHFGASLRDRPPSAAAGGGGEHVWSVETVLQHISVAAREWRAANLRPLPDLKFTYEQEPTPEEFFTPYIWSIVAERAAVGWDPERVVLFSAPRPLDDDSGDGDGAMPALSSIDVDEGAEQHPR